MADRCPHVVIVVVNLPAERDRRVIREAQALEQGGYRVSVICPRGTTRQRILPGTRDTRLYTFPQPLAGTGVVTFAAEFAWALTAVTVRLLVLLLRDRVDAVQACNPPDIFWVPGLLMRALGRPFVFDHHDLSPELYACKTDRPRRPVLAVLRVLERLSWRCASAVVATNESYRELALRRGGCDPDRVVVVRNGPTVAEVDQVDQGVAGADDRSPATPAVPGQRAGADVDQPRHTIVYLGVINEQDRVDRVVLAAAELARLRGTADWRFVVAGDGASLPGLRRLAAEQGVAELVRFTGWLEAGEVDALLRTATLGVQPDPPNPMNELSTMAKTVEYLARGLPVVAADLLETRRSAGAAASYVPTGAPAELAGAVNRLLDDEAARTAMARVARRRFVDRLAWDHQARHYLRLWDRLLRPGHPLPRSRSGDPRPETPDRPVRTVDS